MTPTNASLDTESETRKDRSKVPSRLVRIGAFADRYYLALAVGIILAMTLARTDDWLYRNEIFAWLASGITFDADNPSLLAFQAAAVENCQQFTEEPTSVCRDYQKTFGDSTYFYRPIHGLFGRGLIDSYGTRPWLEDLHAAGLYPHLLGGLLAIALWLIYVRAMPGDSRFLVAAMSVLLLLLGYYRDEASLVMPDFFDGGVRAWEAIALSLFAGAVIFGYRLAERYVLYGGARLVERVLQHRRRVFLALAAVVVLNFALPPATAAVVQFLAFAALLLAMWWMISSQERSPLIVGALLVFLFIMICGDSQFLLRKLEVARTQLYLVFGVYLTYVAIRPRGKLVYALPAFAVFHIPATAMLALALLLAEIPLCLRRLRISPLLLVSAITFALWYSFMLSSHAGLSSQSNLEIGHVFDVVARSPRLWPSALAVLLTASVSLWPLLLRSDRFDHIARCGILALIGVVTTFIAYAFLDVEPGLRLAPGYYQLVSLYKYLGQGLAFAVVLGVTLVLFELNQPQPAERESNAFAVRRAWWRVAPIAGIVLLTGVAKIDLTPRLLVSEALYNAVVYIGLGHLHPDWCRLAPGAGFDDHYILSGDKPTSGAENAFSALKLKLRLARGVHDPAAMTISVVKPDDDGC